MIYAAQGDAPLVVRWVEGKAEVSFTRIASISGLRGIVGAGIDPATAAEFTAAYASGLPSGSVVVGHDGRVSAPVFERAVVAAVLGTGKDALLAGPVATPTLGKLVREHEAVGGIQISASHNPIEYNGLKLFQAGGMVLSKAEGERVVDRFGSKAFGWVRWDELGRASEIVDPFAEHLESVLRIVDVDQIRTCRYSVMLDGCHGAGGRPGERLLVELGCRVAGPGADPDGLYEHGPEPTEENLTDFAAMVREHGADVGFAQDPDADRLAIVDETGRYIGEELTLALAARRVFERNRGTAPFVINLSTSNVSADLARAAGRRVIRTPVGEIHVVEAILGERAILGGEGNGGVIDPRVGYVRDGFVAMALVLDLMASSGKRLSELVDELPKYAMIKRKISLADMKREAFLDRLESLASYCADAELDHRDGIRLSWEERWVQVRASNTEPIARVIAEARDADIAAALAAKVSAWITGDARAEVGA